jgi:hypothetical protein
MTLGKHNPKTVGYLATVETDGVHCTACGLLFHEYREIQNHWIECMRQEEEKESDVPNVP